MFDISILPVFVISVFFLVISPGPDLLLISSYSSARGFKAGIAISIGIFVAGIIQTCLVAMGLGKLMQTMPAVAFAIKLVGAGYLSWLGVNLIRSWLKKGKQEVTSSKVEPISTSTLVYRGCLNNLLNPKALIFFSMFLPQFTQGQENLTSQLLLLGVLLSSIALVINAFFVFSFSQFGSYFSGKLKSGRHVDGVLGIIFIGLAARLVTTE